MVPLAVTPQGNLSQVHISFAGAQTHSREDTSRCTDSSEYCHSPALESQASMGDPGERLSLRRTDGENCPHSALGSTGERRQQPACLLMEVSQLGKLTATQEMRWRCPLTGTQHWCNTWQCLCTNSTEHMWTQVLNREWTEVSATSPGKLQLELETFMEILVDSYLCFHRQNLAWKDLADLANGIFELQTVTDIQR